MKENSESSIRLNFAIITASTFLVHGQCEDDAPLRNNHLPYELTCNLTDHHHPAFHVRRSQAVESATSHLSEEQGDVPLRGPTHTIQVSAQND